MKPIFQVVIMELSAVKVARDSLKDQSENKQDTSAEDLETARLIKIIGTGKLQILFGKEQKLEKRFCTRKTIAASNYEVNQIFFIPPPLQWNSNYKPFSYSRISVNHGKGGGGFQRIVKSIYPLLFLYCRISFILRDFKDPVISLISETINLN